MRCVAAKEAFMDKPEHLRPLYADQTVVLVAEDDVMVRNIARIVLESEGYFILSADHGEEALYISDKFPGTIHLLLSDVRMPVMDGLELKERIGSRRPEMKIILMSGQTPSLVEVPFLQKPFGPDTLKKKVRSVIKTPRLYPPSRTVSE
jgi:DNA-binding NtrC family response regulator